MRNIIIFKFEYSVRFSLAFSNGSFFDVVISELLFFPISIEGIWVYFHLFLILVRKSTIFFTTAQVLSSHLPCIFPLPQLEDITNHIKPLISYFWFSSMEVQSNFVQIPSIIYLNKKIPRIIVLLVSFSYIFLLFFPTYQSHLMEDGWSQSMITYLNSFLSLMS